MEDNLRKTPSDWGNSIGYAAAGAMFILIGTRASKTTGLSFIGLSVISAVVNVLSLLGMPERRRRTIHLILIAVIGCAGTAAFIVQK